MLNIILIVAISAITALRFVVTDDSDKIATKTVVGNIIVFEIVGLIGGTTFIGFCLTLTLLLVLMAKSRDLMVLKALTRLWPIVVLNMSILAGKLVDKWNNPGVIVLVGTITIIIFFIVAILRARSLRQGGGEEHDE